MKYFLMSLLLAGCSSVSFNKHDPDQEQFNKYNMYWERSIKSLE